MQLLRRLFYYFRRNRFEADLEREMRHHLEMKAQNHRAAGVEPRAADYAALRQFGNLGALKEESREAWGFAWLEHAVQDLRYGLRMLARAPGFTAVTVLSLAIGIGANTAIFSLLDTILLRYLPVKHPEELVMVGGLTSYPRFEQYRDRNEVFAGIYAASTLNRIRVDGSGDEAQQVSGRLVSGTFFAVLGVPARLGRTLTPEDDRVPNGHPVVVISHGFWQRKYGGDPAVIGKTVRLGAGVLTGAGTSGFESGKSKTVSTEGTAFTIVGVAPPEFFGDTVGHQQDVWLPMMMQEALMPGRAWLARRTASWVQIMGRLKPGISEPRAAAALDVLLRRILTEEAGSNVSEGRLREIAEARANVRSGAQGFSQIRGRSSQLFPILMGIVAVLLLTACANLANLLLARGAARQREIGVRLALGAGRRRLVRQLFTETLLLAAAGGLAGALIGRWGSELLLTMTAEGVAGTRMNLAPDARILGFTAAVSLLTAIVFGLAPALRATRLDLAASIKEAAADRRGGFPLSKVLVVTQVALSVVLVFAGGLFVRTLQKLNAMELGYDREQMLIMRVDPVSAGHRGEQISAVCRRLLERIRAVPGVRGATFSENGLFSGTESGVDVDIEGFTPSSPRDRVVRFDQVGPDYFETVGIPLLAGRGISAQDTKGSPPVAVINETMARFYFPHANPVGKRISRKAQEGFPGLSLEIVGVARDAQDHNLKWTPVRRFYVSFYQPIDGVTTANYEIRTAIDPGAMTAQLRREAAAVDRAMPVLSIEPLQKRIDSTVVQERLFAKLSAIFGCLALSLACVGLYGVMSYSVVRRTREIGIRMAIGARSGQVLGHVLRETLGLAVLGVVIGIPVALASGGLVEKLLFAMHPNDGVTAAVVSAVMVGVAVLAGFLPARQAARVHPLTALRYE